MTRPRRANAPHPTLGRQILYENGRKPTILQQGGQVQQVPIDRRYATPGTRRAVAPAQQQPMNAGAMQIQQRAHAKGMDAGHDARAAGARAFAGRVRDQRAVDDVASRWPAIDDRPLRAYRRTEPAGITTVGVDPEPLVIDDPGALGAGVYAGATGPLLHPGMDAALRDHLGEQDVLRGHSPEIGLHARYQLGATPGR